MPYSYSKNASIVNREGAWNGLIPRYFVWNDIANLTLSSSNSLSRSLATEAQGFNIVATFIALFVSKSEGPFHGVCKQTLEKSNFFLFSVTYRSKPAALLSPDNSLILSVICSRLDVASIEPPAPKVKRYDGSSGINPSSE